MVFSFERPRARVSDSFYRPECRFIEKSFRKTYREVTPVTDGTVYDHLRTARRREVRSQMRSVEQSVQNSQRLRSSSMPPPATCSSTAARTLRLLLRAREIYSNLKFYTDLYVRRLLLSSAKAVANELSYTPLSKKHPYRLPVESEYMPPAEDSVWPASRPHFHLVSSYDLMLKYLGLETLRSPLPGGY